MFANLCEPSWTFMKLHLNVRKCSWTFVNLCEPSWTFAKLCKPLWTFAKLREPLWTFVNLPEPSKLHLNIRKPSWTFVNLHEATFGIFWHTASAWKSGPFRLFGPGGLDRDQDHLLSRTQKDWTELQKTEDCGLRQVLDQSWSKLVLTGLRPVRLAKHANYFKIVNR